MNDTNTKGGFPRELISDVLCVQDGAGLRLEDSFQVVEGTTAITHGTLRCGVCNAAYAIENGILNMLKANVLDAESSHEQKLRDEVAGTSDPAIPKSYQEEHSSVEVIPTLEALSVDRQQKVLELGCGGGRFTLLLADKSRSILAIDFSMVELRLLRQKLIGQQNVGLIAGDITTIRVQSMCFDRVLSTLVSNLPSRAHRDAMYRLAASALKPDGRFVYSTHLHGIRQWLSGQEKSGRYRPGGIYRYNFTVPECIAEIQPYFNRVKARPIQAYVPYAMRMRLPLRLQSRILERIPLLKNLADLILCITELPKVGR